MSRYLYYPGCSMDGSGRAYGESLTGVCEQLGVTLAEIDDWNCCGATEYVGVSLSPAYALIARNLAIAAKSKQNGEPLVAACSACYLNLAKADHYMKERPLLNERVNVALDAGGLHYDPGTVEVRHLLEVIMNDVGLDEVRAKVVKPLAGLRVAPYLGCMLPRPDPDNRWKNHERPDDLDRLLAALGADVVDFPLKTECCGGHMTQIAPKVGLELIKRLVDEAEHREADMMVTVCPMCQINIDAYQGEMNAMFHTKSKMPIVFFTQLMGIAFGLDPKKMGIGRELTDARKALKKIGKAPVAVAAEAGPAHRPRPDKRALPMPRMDTDATALGVAPAGEAPAGAAPAEVNR
jgi:heterodisulfide reductase subunit B